MATRRGTTSLFVVLLGLGAALLLGDAAPQGYQTRYRRDQRCPKCPRDCSEQLAGGLAPVQQYTPPAQPAQPQYVAPAGAQLQYAIPAAAQPPYTEAAAQPAQSQYTAPAQPLQYAVAAQPQPPYLSPHPTPAPYVTPSPQYPIPPAQPYQPAQLSRQPPSRYDPPCNCLCNRPPSGDFNPYECPGCDCEYGCRCSRSLDTEDDYAIFRRSADNKRFDPKKEYRQEPLPFADESSPPANFYKNYRPYVRDIDRSEYESEEQSSRRSRDNDGDRLFVVYRADAFDDKPSDSELESVIRQAMDVARQQKTQEDFALNGRRKPKSNHYRYEHEKFNRDTERAVDFEPLKEETEAEGETRFNLSPGPLMNVGETYVTEEGDDALNPGLDQSKWTAVPSLSDLELIKPEELEGVEEIEAAVSVVPEMSKTKGMKVPKIMQKAAEVAGGKEKAKKETIGVVRTDEIEKKEVMVPELAEDMRTPLIVTESTNFQRPVESPVTSASTTNASLQ